MAKKKGKKKSPEEIEKELQEQQRIQLCLIAQKLEEDLDVEAREFNEMQQERTYKQKVKHLLHEYQSKITSQYIDSELSRKKLEDKHNSDEELLKYDIHALQLQLRELELQHEDYLKTLKQEHDRMISEKRQEIERKAEEYLGRYNDLLNNLKETMENQRRDELELIDKQKRAHIENLRLAHEKAFADIKNYYNDITHNNLDLIKSLKEEVATLKKKEAQDEKMMYDIAQQNKNMAEPLSQALEQVKLLRSKLSQYERDKQKLNLVEDELLIKEEELSVAEWEFEVLKQRYDALEYERNRMYDTFQDAVYDVQQKAGLRNILLEKRLAIIKEEIIKREAQLNEVLSQASLDTTVMGNVTRKLDDIIEGRNQIIRDLQAELERVVRAHNVTIETYEGRMTDYCVPVEELGFKPKYAKMPDIGLPFEQNS